MYSLHFNELYNNRVKYFSIFVKLDFIYNLNLNEVG